MARPRHTYRAARRNDWRGSGMAWWPYRLSGSNWKHEFNAEIKERLHQPRGWPWKQGGRAVLNKVKAIWRSGSSLEERVAEIRGMVNDATQ